MDDFEIHGHIGFCWVKGRNVSLIAVKLTKSDQKLLFCYAVYERFFF